MRFLAMALLTVACPVLVASAQHAFISVDKETRVGSVKFSGNHTLEDRDLHKVVTTAAPSFLDRVSFWKNKPFLFSPVELQKDVARLRRQYSRHGFVHATVDYQAVLDSAGNKLDVEFLIEEGAPIILQSVDFVGPDGRAASHAILESERKAWRIMRRKNTTYRVGYRPSLPELLRIQTELRTWLRRHGYAFGDVELSLDVDSTANLADVKFRLLPGPVTNVGSITVDWIDETPIVSDRVVLRELPFKPGDLYSHREITHGQRSLFGLNIFRFALIDIPEQEPDSTVDLRIRVQRGDLNLLRATTGYSLDDGVDLTGEFTRRNFLGDARRLTLSGILNTDIGETGNGDLATSTRERVALSLFQPYVFRRSLSALVSGFYDKRNDRIVQEEEFGGSTTLLYEILPFRSISTGVSITRARPLGSSAIDDPDSFIRGIYSISALLGRTNNYLEPEEGFLIRPSLEIGTPLLLSEVEYVKAGLSLTGYLQTGRRGGFAARLFHGRLWPTGQDTEDDILTSARYDKTRYYAGGSDDVRGWAQQALGPKIAVQDTLDSPEFRYEPVGALDKWLGALSYRFPVSLFPPEIQWAVFVDAARLREDEIRVGSGFGIRYRTPIGFLRFDLAMKINPSEEDLRDPEDVIKQGGIDNVPPDQWKRFRFHFGIGHAF